MCFALSQEREIDQCFTQKPPDFDGSDESAKARNRLQPAKGRSRSEMRFEDIGAGCHVRDDRTQPSCSLLL